MSPRASPFSNPAEPRSKHNGCFWRHQHIAVDRRILHAYHAPTWAWGSSLDRFLYQLGFRDPGLTGVEIALFVGAWIFCLYWFRAAFLARDGIRNYVDNLIDILGQLYCFGFGLFCLAAPLNRSLGSHVIFSIGIVSILVGLRLAFRPPRRRGRAIPKYIRDAVIARDLGGKPFDPSKHHIDHIWPFILGGSHSLENLRVYDKTKNLQKGSKRPRMRDMWEKTRERL